MGLISLYAEAEPLELRAYASEDDWQAVIRAVYKQVLGNAYLMESERLASGESLLRHGDLTVRGFVRIVAQSELYQSQFFHNCSPYRFIELNYKHLLGRAPQDQGEISEHVQIYNEQGYEVEIDSYIDSDEYIENFGENIVPYPRSVRSQTGIKNVGFNRMFSLLRGFPTSDRGKSAQLISDVAGNLATKVKAAAVGNGANYGNTGKRFRIEVTKAALGPRFKQSNATYEVSYAQMSEKIQNIHQTGGRILRITEVAS